MSRVNRSARLLCVGLAGTRLAKNECNLLARLAPGAVILFKRNYENRELLIELCRAIHNACDPPPLIGVDQEGGRVIRFGPPFVRLEPARTLAAKNSPEEIEALATSMARELRSVGIDLDFAPVLDVLTNSANQVIGDRAFGVTADRVIRNGLAMVRGLIAGGLIPCAKHFPGHGNVREDSHFELPVSRVSRRSLFAVHLRPFQAAIAANVPMIMMAHLIAPAIDRTRPASISAAAVDLLRKQLNFDGVIATDDLQMEALRSYGSIEDRAVAALEAGADLLLVCREIEATEQVFSAIEQAKASPHLSTAIDQAIERIARMRQ